MKKETLRPGFDSLWARYFFFPSIQIVILSILPRPDSANFPRPSCFGISQTDNLNNFLKRLAQRMFGEALSPTGEKYSSYDV